MFELWESWLLILFWLISNIPLQETIDICANTLFENTEVVVYQK